VSEEQKSLEIKNLRKDTHSLKNQLPNTVARAVFEGPAGLTELGLIERPNSSNGLGE
jgi:hypothetical protein